MSEPWVRFEDEHLLVVSKPAGVSTHRSGEHGQDGMYEWVQAQRSGVSLSILHRLDKATSGLLLFGKSIAANRSLAAQFEQRTIAKRYELLALRDDRRGTTLRNDQPIERIERGRTVVQEASTTFELVATGESLQRYVARPTSGRTHQVRLHATGLGMAIVGDQDHGGVDGSRLFLHAASLRFEHPDGGVMELVDDPPASFDAALSAVPSELTRPGAAALAAGEARQVLFDASGTEAYVWIDRHHDGFADVRVERLGDVGLVLDYRDTDAPIGQDWIDAWMGIGGLRALYAQRRPRVGSAGPAVLLAGETMPRFVVTELGCRYVIDLEASPTSSGLFLDQRETRRQLLRGERTGSTVLNTFAHTGSLSVAAALAGAETLTLDLSPHYLDWARTNLVENGIDVDDHDFIYGDALDWMGRLAKKGRRFDLVLVDPPSASTTRKGKRWTVERDLHELVQRAAELCADHGQLFVSTNLRKMKWQKFLDHLERGLTAAGRDGRIETQTLPLDHRTGPGDPPYLKAAWVSFG